MTCDPVCVALLGSQRGWYLSVRREWDQRDGASRHALGDPTRIGATSTGDECGWHHMQKRVSSFVFILESVW